MPTAVALIVFGILCRLVPHPPNFSPFGALSLYAGARLPRRWSWAVPLVAMALSDTILEFGTGRSTFSFVRGTIYATYAATALLASWALRGRTSTWTLPAWSLAASTLFFLTTNLAVWATGGGMYPPTAAGLVACYASALPFFGKTLVADLVGTLGLFGLDGLVRHGDSLAWLEETGVGARPPREG
jgi:hypothetical protein